MNTSASNNHWSHEILEHFNNEPGKAWVKLGWRQYLSWFGKTELALSATDPKPLVKDWLKVAEDNWLMLQDSGVLMDEPRNDGSWIRSWRQALTKFQKDAS